MSFAPIAAGTRAAGPPEGVPTAETARRGRRSTPYLLLLPGLGWLVLFFAVPLVALGSTSLQTRVPGAEVGVYTQTFRWANYSDALREYAPHFGRSFLYAGIATALCLLVGYPLAYAIALRAGRWRNLMLVAVIAPFFTSFILRTIAWRQILADSGPVTGTLHALNLLPADQSLTASPVAVVAGLTYNFLPFMVLPLYASLERLDPALLEAAADLGSPPRRSFWQITVPLARPGIIAGLLLVFIPAVGEFIIPDLLGGSGTLMIGRTLWNEFFSNRDWPVASAVAIVLLLVLVVPMVFFQNAQAKVAEASR